MESFFHWFNQQQISLDQPWVILGKGPSFSKRGQFDLNSFKTISLNHVIREVPVTLAHAIDLDVVKHCEAAIERNAQAVVMPWVPHVNNEAGRETLQSIIPQVPVLRRLSEQGRLLWYNSSTSELRHAGAPVVEVKSFSAEAALNLLAMAGVRHVRSLGIDGGNAYSGAFQDLVDTTLLNNGHESFDRQFAQFAKIIQRTGVDYAPLDIDSPIRIYVGSLEEQMLAVKVLEYSIRKHASMTVEVLPLHQAALKTPVPRDAKNAPRTPFSFQRFLIPALAQRRGRAIYLDSDMQLFADIRQLWVTPFNGGDLLAASKPNDSERRPQFSVMLLDCEALEWDIGEIVARLDRGELTYEQLMFEMSVAKNIRADLDPRWNSLEHFEPGRTALLHYTDMATQPWISRANPLGHLWMRDLIEAVDAGYIDIDYIRKHVELGYVRPSLFYQVANQIEDTGALPPKACALDDSYLAPYQQMGLSIEPPINLSGRYMNWLKTKWLVKSALNHLRKRPTLNRLENSIRYRARMLAGTR
ncbi:MAG TPA: hypothetical protein VJT50_14060 [Pyrinomonadaceae bacterium]|nr:hypothetical protein [Pyrinomonadaceae bacterium]